MVGIIGNNLSKLVLYFTSSFIYPGAWRLLGSVAFTRDVKLPASRADRLYLIAFEAQ